MLDMYEVSYEESREETIDLLHNNHLIDFGQLSEKFEDEEGIHFFELLDDISIPISILKLKYTTSDAEFLLVLSEVFCFNEKEKIS